MTEATQITKATLAQRIAINEVLKKVLYRNGDGLWHYVEGYNDHAVAAQVPGCNNLHVRSVRKEMFGNVRRISVPGEAPKPEKGGTGKKILQLLEQTNERLARMEARLSALEETWK